MRLMHGKISPFVRKVMVAAIEKGLDGALELVPTAVGAGKINRELLQINPNGKIPTLVLDNGEIVFDSLVICDQFDFMVPVPQLIPSTNPARLRALRVNAIADGLLTAGVLAKGEAARPAERQWPEFLTAQWAKVEACIAVLDRELAGTNEFTIGEIAAGCALGWLEFRAPEERWKQTFPGLGSWYAAFSQRESMQRTAPQA